MKRMTLVIFLLIFATLIGCDAPTNAKVEKPVLNTDKETLKSNVSVGETPIPIHQIKSKQPLIWTGFVEFEEDTLKSPGAFSEGDAVEAEFPGETAIGTIVEVDLMNCAGFLADAELIYSREPSERSNPKWHLRVIPEKVAADVKEKINLCHSRDYSEYPYSCKAFAVAPSNNKRKDIKIGKVDTRKLFASLDSETKQRANMKHKEIHREKNNLTLERDNWTDIDGDGQIDLVQMSAACSIESAYTCGSLLLLINGKWKEIGFITPA